MVIFYEQPFIKITWDEAVNCVELEFSGFAFGKPYREAMDKALELHLQKGCRRCLSDMRRSDVVDKDDMQWVSEDWVRRAKAVGVRRISVVLPESVVGTMQVQQAHRKVVAAPMEELGMNIELFSNYEKARRWLTSG